eukprot:g20284.t1
MGMRNHECLNGRPGEVLSRVADEHGFLMVRVQMPEGPKNMKVQPRCLKPIRHPKDGRTRGARLTGFIVDPEVQSVLSSRPATASAVQSVLRTQTPLVADSVLSKASPLAPLSETNAE